MKPFLSPAPRILIVTTAASLILGQAFAAESAPTRTLITGATIFNGTNEALITGNNGKVLALSGLKNPYPGAAFGLIQGGAFADILLVNGDPTKDIRLLMDARKNVALIMKDGKIYKNTLR